MTRAWVVAAASAAIVILVSTTVPLFIDSDEAYQLKAAQQTLVGESPVANALTLADPADLTVTTPAWIHEWPPSTQLAAFPLMRAGIPVGVALRVAAAMALLVGAVGWLRWWSTFGLPRPWVLTAAVLLPWERTASHGVFQYSAHALVFGILPWVLLATRRLAASTDERPHLDVAFMTGLAAGALYWVQYSALFASAGCAAFLLLAGRASRPRRVETLSFLAGAVVPVAVLSIANHNLGDATAQASHSYAFDPRAIVYLLGNAGHRAAGAYAVFNDAFAGPHSPVRISPGLVAALGVPAGITLAWLLAGVRTLEERLAAVTMAVTAALVLVAWSWSRAITPDAEQLAGAAMACLPAAIAVAQRRWHITARPVRAWLVAIAVVFVGCPWIYGPASVIAKAARANGYRATDTRLYNPRLAEHDVPAAVAAIREACRAATPPFVWYVPDPLSALELSGPMLVTRADTEPAEQLASRTYRGAASVCALLPPSFEANGKGPLIRASFLDVTSWERHPIAAANYDLWIGH